MRRTSTSILTGLAAALVVAAAGPAHGTEPAVVEAVARAQAAGVDSARLAQLVARAEARHLPAPAVLSALAAVETAASKGLPVGPVVDKVLEGFAKGVPAQRMMPVVQEIVSRLGAADAALHLPASQPGRSELVEQGAESLRRGASAEALAAVADAGGAPGVRLALGLRELGDLGEARLGNAEAGKALGLMVRRGYPDAAISGLSDQLRDALDEGADPAELLAEVESRAAAGRPIDRLVDPFSERPGAVIHDNGVGRGRGDLPDEPGSKGKGRAKGKGLSPLDRPGAAGSLSPGQEKHLSKGQDGKPKGPKGPPR